MRESPGEGQESSCSTEIPSPRVARNSWHDILSVKAPRTSSMAGAAGRARTSAPTDVVAGHSHTCGRASESRDDH